MGDFGFLTLQTALPIVLSAFLYCAQKKRGTSLAGNMRWQVLCGVAFGAVAIVATETGASIGGALVNVRNAAPVCAGLIFGAPAGVIAGCIGGVERWLCVYWSDSAYAQVACSIGTVVAGVASAVLRRHVFERRIPEWYFGLLVGVLVETLDLLLVVLTHISDVTAAFLFVFRASVPMICLNGLSVAIAILVVSRMARGRQRGRRGIRHITQTFQKWLATAVTVMLLVAIALAWMLQTALAETNAKSLLEVRLDDVKGNMEARVGAALLSQATYVGHQLAVTTAQKLDLFLERLAWEYDLDEINVISTEGIVELSSNPDNIGFDLSQNERAAEFLEPVRARSAGYQDFGPSGYAPEKEFMYANIPLDDGRSLQVGLEREHYLIEARYQLAQSGASNHVGQNGLVLIADTEDNLYNQPVGESTPLLSGTGLPADLSATRPRTMFVSDVYGEPSFCMYEQWEDVYIVDTLPLSEAYFERSLAVCVMVFMDIVVFATLFLLVYWLVCRLIVRNIQKFNVALGEITGGNLDVTVNVRSNAEFASLSDDINSTVGTLKRLIGEAAARIDEELRYARDIQMSALPSSASAFEDHPEFEIDALMRPAKEVGGDFYDFYLLDADHLAFLVADVSGKGIPAAMFMMTAKRLIKDLAQAGLPPAEVFARANDELCKGNTKNMFVTSWLGVLNVRTGHLRYVNAGHNLPCLNGPDSEYQFLKGRRGLVLGGMSGLKYRENECMMSPGDTIFLYTDGITEAVDATEEEYGNDRLLRELNANQDLPVADINRHVQNAVDAFSSGEEQFDDMTTVAVRYVGVPRLASRQMEAPAAPESLALVTSFAEEALESCEVPPDAAAKMCVAIDEIATNIVRHSGASTMLVEIEARAGRALVRFTDDGRPYDPTLLPEPDTSLPTDKRGIGGLGVHLVRNLMDEVHYSYLDGRNRLSFEKRYGATGSPAGESDGRREDTTSQDWAF